ncbi:MAG: right-handed parallel beta-helix repeat-containing protein, partial [Betaproteobacteria bacterium]
MRGAVYNEVDNCNGCEGRAVLQITKPGTATQWIRFVAEPGESVILEGTSSATIGVRIVKVGATFPSFNEVNGFQMRGFSLDCVSYDSVPDIRLAGLDVTRCGRQAVSLKGGKRVTLQGSRIHDNNTNGWTSAIDLYQCQDGNIISGNAIWNNSDSSPGQPDSEGHGIIMDYCPGTGGTVIENNQIFNNEGWCVVVLNSNGATIRNNVCYHNGIRSGGGEITTCGNRVSIYNNIVAPRAGQLALNLRLQRSDFTVDPTTVSENNDLLDVTAAAVAVGWGDATGTLSQFQARNGRGWGTRTILGDPRFVDEFGLNFRLQSGSPAIDKGDTAHAALVDFDGVRRPSGIAADIGAFEVSAGAALAGSAISSSASVNLTATGTRDWAHWPNYIHKSSGGSQISNFTAVGGATVLSWTPYAPSVTWSDGTPTASRTDRAGVYTAGTGKGLQIRAAAGTGLRTLKVHISGYKCRGRLVAHLSDNSMPDYVDQSFFSSTGNYDGVYTITYRANSDA